MHSRVNYRCFFFLYRLSCMALLFILTPIPCTFICLEPNQISFSPTLVGMVGINADIFLFKHLARILDYCTGWYQCGLRILFCSDTLLQTLCRDPETVFKEKHGVWDPMPKLTITSPYVDSKTFTMGNPMPETTLTLWHTDKKENKLFLIYKAIRRDQLQSHIWVWLTASSILIYG